MKTYKILRSGLGYGIQRESFEPSGWGDYFIFSEESWESFGKFRNTHNAREKTYLWTKDKNELIKELKKLLGLWDKTK